MARERRCDRSRCSVQRPRRPVTLALALTRSASLSDRRTAARVARASEPTGARGGDLPRTLAAATSRFHRLTSTSTTSRCVRHRGRPDSRRHPSRSTLMPRRLPSPALVVAGLALVVALGGTTYAATALPKNSVGAKQLKSGSVSTVKLAKGSVTSRQIKDHTIVAADIAKSAIPALRARSRPCRHRRACRHREPRRHGRQRRRCDASRPSTTAWARIRRPSTSSRPTVSRSPPPATPRARSSCRSPLRAATRSTRCSRRMTPGNVRGDSFNAWTGEALRHRCAPRPARPDAREPAPDLPESVREAGARRHRGRQRRVQRRDQLLRRWVRDLLTLAVRRPGQQRADPRAARRVRGEQCLDRRSAHGRGREAADHCSCRGEASCRPRERGEHEPVPEHRDQRHGEGRGKRSDQRHDAQLPRAPRRRDA